MPTVQDSTWKRGSNLGNQHHYNLRSHRQESYRSRAAKYLLAQHLYLPYFANHIYDSSGKKLTIDDLITGPDSVTRWLPALSNE